MPKAKTTAAKKATKSEPKPLDVKKLRRELGVSQSAFAKLVGASGGSVQNWERGKPISDKYVARLRALAKQAKVAAVPGRGGRPKKEEGPARAKRTDFVGDVATIYANVLDLVHGEHDSRLRLGLALAGQQGVRLVADVIVPRGLAERLP